MKLFGENRDRAIDTLLRAHVPRRSDVSEPCSEFDPDLASAYVERRLTSALLSRYEEHLSGCSACRKNVVAVSRTAVPELTPARPSGVRLRDVFGVLSRPQWALAATAVIALVISLPLLLSRSHNELSGRTSPLVSEQQAIDVPTATPSANDSSTSQTSLPATAKPHEERIDRNLTAASKRTQAPAMASQERRREEKSDNESTDEVKRKAETQSTSQVAAAAPESQAPKSDSDKGHQQQQKDSAQGGESKGRADEASGKETVQVTASTPAPPPAPRARALKPPARKLALRDNATSESVRPAERKVVNKRFLWKDGAWTDKEFDP